MKKKKKKLGIINLNSICTAKETLNKRKRQPPEWEKLFANVDTVPEDRPLRNQAAHSEGWRAQVH